MKERISILVILISLITINVSNAQKTTIYVWDFLNKKGKQDDYTKRITRIFESHLQKYSEKYIVLERRNFSKSFEMQKSENAILSLNDIAQYKSKLKTIKADAVVLGDIINDKISNIFTLYIKFQIIETTEILEDEYQNIQGEIYYGNIKYLQDTIKNFVSKIINGKLIGHKTFRENVISPLVTKFVQIPIKSAQIQIKSVQIPIRSVQIPIKYLNKFKFGVRAGLNLANPFETKLENSKSLKMIPAYHVGGIVAYSLSKAFSLESGLLLSGKGAKLEEVYNSGAICSSTISPHYLEMPFNLLYSFDLRDAKLCLFVGGYLGVGISGKIKSESANDYNSIFGLINESTDIRFGTSADSHLKLTDFGWNIGGGVEIKIFLFRAQYNLGFSGMGLKNLGAKNIKSSVLEFSIGYMLLRI
ncbi:MAG: porin family protein [Mariniphaga sp.]